MDIRKIKQKLHEEKSRIGLIGGTLEVVEYDEAENNVSACIAPQGWNISIQLKKGFNPISDKRQKAYARKKKIVDGLETLVSDVFLHECAHWELPHGTERGCPYDTYNHDKILEAVKDNLPDDKKQQAHYVANAFEDMIINPRVHEYKGNFSGQVLFWDNEGMTLRQKGQDKFTPFYEAFVKLNMHLFGDKADKALLKRYYANWSKVDRAVKEVITSLDLPEGIEDTSALFQRNEWPKMAGQFTKALATLLEVTPTERLSAYSNPEKGNGGGGNQGQPESGNGIEQKVATREGKEDVSFGRYKSKDKQSPNFTSFEQLDSLYRKLAKGIPVKVETMTRESNLNIAPLNFRVFNEDTDDPTKIKSSKLFLDEGGIEFAYPNQPLTVVSRSKIQQRSFPDFKLVVLDNSSSMKDAVDCGSVGQKQFIPWGDRSKYHFALLGFYGIENFLQNQGIAQYINHGLSLFSSSTRYKEGGFPTLAEVRKLALSPDWGSTNLDAKLLAETLQGRESFVLSLSDGEIANWYSERNNFKKLAEKAQYAHIQIGGQTEFTQDLESWKLPVFYVNSGEQMSRLMVDLTKSAYRRYVKQ